MRPPSRSSATSNGSSPTAGQVVVAEHLAFVNPDDYTTDRDAFDVFASVTNQPEQLTLGNVKGPAVGG
jgi:hypothetical protein